MQLEQLVCTSYCVALESILNAISMPSHMPSLPSSGIHPHLLGCGGDVDKCLLRIHQQYLANNSLQLCVICFLCSLLRTIFTITHSGFTTYFQVMQNADRTKDATSRSCCADKVGKKANSRSLDVLSVQEGSCGTPHADRSALNLNAALCKHTNMTSAPEATSTEANRLITPSPIPKAQFELSPAQAPHAQLPSCRAHSASTQHSGRAQKSALNDLTLVQVTITVPLSIHSSLEVHFASVVHADFFVVLSYSPMQWLPIQGVQTTNGSYAGAPAVHNEIQSGDVLHMGAGSSTFHSGVNFNCSQRQCAL
jgi:hypothetical protein